MRRKQLFAVLMAGSMAASLAACGKTDTKKTTAATEKKTEAATEKKTEVATTEAKTEKATEKETEAATEKETEAATEAKTEEASSEEATEAKTEEASSEEASSEEASSEDVSAQAETEEESSEVATEAKTEEASNEEVSIEEVSSEEASSEEASSEEVSSEEASSEEASSEEASSEEASSEEASSEEASSEEASSEKASSEEASSEEETEAETEEDIDGTGFKIGMVTDVGGVNDGPFNQSAWEGLQRAAENFGCEVKYIESKGDADFVPNIESFLDEDYDLIICTGYVMADAVRDAAELNPDQKFAIVDDASNADLDNVTCMMFEQEQASYLVGLAAGYTTESNVVGFVVGQANETMNSFGYGYCAGVLDANPDATILQ